MIQRIQTVFLIVTVILMGIMLFTPLATIVDAYDTYYILRADSFSRVTEGQNVSELVVWPLFILIIILTVLPLTTIFLFKKRLLQMRFCIFESILNVLFYVLFFYELKGITNQMDEAITSYNVYILPLPLVAIIFNLLAWKRIGQDEMLIKSLNSNRIR